jgi:hypothetical protein
MAVSTCIRSKKQFHAKAQRKKQRRKEEFYDSFAPLRETAFYECVAGRECLM